LEMVDIESISAEDAQTIYELVHNHYKYTQSELAYKILDNFSRLIHKFVKVMPREYKRILEMKQAEEIPELQEVLDG